MFRRLLNLFRPNRLEAEIREELAYHRDRTRGRFGKFTAIQDQTREASTIVWLETLVQDVRYGFRQLGRTPLVTLTAVLSLALGIGANTAIFTLINAVMLQSLPVRDAGRLVLFYDGVSTGVYSGVAFPGDIFSYRCWEYFRDHNEAFEDLSAFSQGSEDLMMRLSSGAGRREPAKGHLVSGSYFSVLGVQAAVGRVLTPADDALAAPPVAVISDKFWRQLFHADSSAIGTAVDLNGMVFTIVGVAPREFFGERVQQPPDFWIPLTFQPQIMQRESLAARTDIYWLNLIGRLKPGVTLARAQAGLNTQLHQFYTAQAGAHPTTDQQRKIGAAHTVLKPGERGISWARFTYSEPLRLLMAIVALVLLIACANIATLLLARASARQRELFVRLALGSSRQRLIRQLLTESVLLALLGGAAGVALAWWSVKALGVTLGISSVIPLRPDLLVLGFTLGISVLAGIGFGLVPALRAGRIELRSSPEARTSATALSRFKPARALVILQVTLSFPLLAGAALLTHSLLKLESQDLGFQRENLLLVRTDPRAAGYQPADLNALYRQIYDRLNALPGVFSASMTNYGPLSGRSSSGNFSLQGYTPRAGQEMNMYIVNVGPGFFETMGIPLLLGRSIGPRDTTASPLVAVVSQEFVREYLPGQNPIGRRFCKGAPFRDPGVEIVGVVADSKYYDPRAKPKPMAYFAAWQVGGSAAYISELAIRTVHDASGAAAAVRRALQAIDDKLPVENITTMHERVEKSVRQERLTSCFCGFFGLLSLLLAAIGLYGTMAYAVSRRTGEIGVRMALGARRADVLWMVLRESLLLVGLGLACGLPLALAGTRWIKSFLFGITPVDPLGIGAAAVLLVVASALASYLPARRATQVDPLTALRYE